MIPGQKQREKRVKVLLIVNARVVLRNDREGVDEFLTLVVPRGIWHVDCTCGGRLAGLSR